MTACESNLTPQYIKCYAKEHYCDNPDTFYSSCELFRSFLKSENEKYNLTSIPNNDEFWIKHIFDSISLIRIFPDIIISSKKIADIGSGAGFPAIPLALILKNSKVFAIDSNGKKAGFLQAVKEKLSITNLFPLKYRMREFSSKKEYIASFDLVTARAVGNSYELFKESRRSLNQNGMIIFYKTPDTALNEIRELRKKTEKFPFEWDISNTFDLPFSAGERVFLFAKRKK